jgi:high-affinity nickel-transport protein
VLQDPPGRIATIRNRLTPDEWLRVAGMTITVVVLNALGWALLAAAGGHYHVAKGQVFGLGTGVLAYTLGMRHAFDADHIAAIDNTTRKLINEGKRPLSVGYFFSLGHSTIVFLLAVVLNFGIRALDGAVRNSSSGWHKWTSIIGTSISGTFLYLIALLNLIVLVSIVNVTREMRQGRYDEAELERQLDSRGLLNRFLGGYARRIDSPARMYPVGLLFGLGFDTATEIALLVFIGTIEILGLLAHESGLKGGFWGFLQDFDMNRAGFVIAGVFVVTWMVALAVWHFGDIERKWEQQAARAYAQAVADH